MHYLLQRSQRLLKVTLLKAALVSPRLAVARIL